MVWRLFITWISTDKFVRAVTAHGDILLLKEASVYDQDANQ